MFLMLVLQVFLVMPSMLHAQDTMVDLLQELEASEDDSSRADILNRIAAKHFELNQLDKAFEVSTEAFNQAMKIDFGRGEAKAASNIATYYDHRDQYRNAIDWYTSSIRIYARLNDSVQMARILRKVGSVYMEIASYDTARFYLYQSRDILERQRDTADLANTMNRIGDVYNSWGDYEEALENFMIALQLYKSTGNSLGMSNAYCFIGGVYRKLGEYDRAGNYLEIALELNQGEGPTRDIIPIYNELGILYCDGGRWKEAVSIFEKSLNLARYYEDNKLMADCFDNLGMVYNAQEDYEKALGLYRRAHSLRQELGIQHGILLSNINLAGVYIEMAKGLSPGRHKASYSDALTDRSMILSLLEKSLEIARSIGDYSDLDRIYESFIQAHATFRDYDQAAYYQGILLQFRDSLADNNQMRTLAELQARFEKEQQEQELHLLNSQHKVQLTLMQRQQVERYIYTGSGITLVLLIIGLWNRMNFMSSARNELQEKNLLIAGEKRKAEESEKVKEQFLAKMSHEIRIPMNTIMGSVNIILKNDHLPNQEKYLHAIRQSSENLLVIIDDILDLTRLEAGKLNLEEAQFSIRREVENIGEILSFKASEKGIGLHIEIDDSLPPVVIGDSTRLNQVLLNLVGNGIKFTEKGNVTIRATVVGNEAEKAMVRFEVADTGIGIPADRLDKIFSSFTQADSDTTRKYGGTGLGLTISKQLVEMQNGNVGVSSEPGKGSLFFFEIPYAVVKDADVVDGKMPNVVKEVLQDLKILVVEDDEFNVMVLMDTLSSSLDGVFLDVADNGKDALQKWEEGDFDIILMDIELPEMNGHEVTRAIRRSGRMGNGVPIIAMTANAMMAEMEACFNSGMNDFISKPFDQDDLILKINRLLINQQKV